ncbi:hypothetical protein KTG15_12470 [Methanobacterium sp. YSL]|nr:hypothetical protein [Methanobacterium sp. YSL]
MKKSWIMLVFSLVLTMAACTTKPLPTTDPNDPKPNEELPIDNSRFHNPFGFSSLVITTRESHSPHVVSDVVSFLDALLDQTIPVIRIDADLSLGSKTVNEALLATGKSLSSYSSVYRPHSRQPLTHPTLLETGVGQIRIMNRQGLMIYSDQGVKIKHAGFLIEDSSDIVIRNLHLTEFWEWDDLSEGQYKRNDWDYFNLKDVDGVWFDHLTFDQVYDGIIDLKERSKHVTLSWSKLNFNPNEHIELQINALEVNRSSYPYYDHLRNTGLSVADLKLFASFQKKGFNLGNTTDGSGFETITMTFHHLQVYNLMDRMPRLRKGDVHLYHILLDNSLLYETRLRLTHPDLSFVNQGLVSTEGGSILIEHSIFKYVSSPIKNHQDSNPDSKYTGSYQVINSELIQPNRTHFGSSTDKNTLWIHTGSQPILPYVMRNYTELPYPYTLADVYYLAETFETYTPGVVFMKDFNWLLIDPKLAQKGA